MSRSVWLTADTHFRHRAMAADGKGWRPFATVDEHDKHLVARWNEVVRPGDQVWHLGDVGIGPVPQTLATVARLHGEKHLITGNHDQVWPGNREAHKHQRTWLEFFTSVQAYARRKINGQYALLCHFPYSGDHTEDERYTEYRLHDEGKWLIHGHVHDLWAQHGRQINVGVDVHEWAPVSLDELTTFVKTEGRMAASSLVTHHRLVRATERR